MKEDRNYTLYFDSTWGSVPEHRSVAIVDLARNPREARALIDLGLLLKEDLPCLIVRDATGKIRLIQTCVSAEDVAHLVSGEPTSEGPIVVYGAAWCPDCRVAKRLLRESETPFREVTIDEDPVAEQMVIARSGGRRVVPTIVFGERLFAFNPPRAEFKAMLRQNGPDDRRSPHWEEAS